MIVARVLIGQRQGRWIENARVAPEEPEQACSFLYAQAGIGSIAQRSIEQQDTRRWIERAYASVMVPVDLVSIAATLGALLLFFRRDIPKAYDVGALRAPRDAIRDPATFRAGWIVLALLLAGFFLLEPLGVPVSAVAAAGAILLL